MVYIAILTYLKVESYIDRLHQGPRSSPQVLHVRPRYPTTSLPSLGIHRSQNPARRRWQMIVLQVALKCRDIIDVKTLHV